MPAQPRTDVVELFSTVEGAEGRGYRATAVGQTIVAQAASVPDLHIAVQAALNAHVWVRQRPTRVRLIFIDDKVLAGWPLDLNPPG